MIITQNDMSAKRKRSVLSIKDKDLLNAHGLEDWFNLDSELPTTEQMPDKHSLKQTFRIKNVLSLFLLFTLLCTEKN